VPEPGDAHALADAKAPDVCTETFDATDDLVTRNNGQLGFGKFAIGIHMSDLPSMPYALLWGERVVRSVANLTRQWSAPPRVDRVRLRF
jgi:hypothetical protein